MGWETSAGRCPIPLGCWVGGEGGGQRSRRESGHLEVMPGGGGSAGVTAGEWDAVVLQQRSTAARRENQARSLQSCSP